LLLLKPIIQSSKRFNKHIIAFAIRKILSHVDIHNWRTSNEGMHTWRVRFCRLWRRWVSCQDQTLNDRRNVLE
jgi:hypothetical protein